MNDKPFSLYYNNTLSNTPPGACCGEGGGFAVKLRFFRFLLIRVGRQTPIPGLEPTTNKLTVYHYTNQINGGAISFFLVIVFFHYFYLAFLIDENITPKKWNCKSPRYYRCHFCYQI